MRGPVPACDCQSNGHVSSLRWECPRLLQSSEQTPGYLRLSHRCRDSLCCDQLVSQQDSRCQSSPETPVRCNLQNPSNKCSGCNLQVRMVLNLRTLVHAASALWLCESTPTSPLLPIEHLHATPVFLKSNVGEIYVQAGIKYNTDCQRLRQQTLFSVHRCSWAHIMLNNFSATAQTFLGLQAHETDLTCLTDRHNTCPSISSALETR